LACIAIHSRHIDIRSLEKQWNANEIMLRLSKLHPEFFPRAVKLTEIPEGFDCQDIEPPLMTRQEFLRLYASCGASLHRGSLRNALRSNTPQNSYQDIRDILTAIVNLLNTHRIPSPDLKTHYVCNMINGSNGPAAMITAEFQ